MKKTLMALAVGAAFAAPAAYADVTISGSINMGIAYAKSGDGSTGAGNSITNPNGGPPITVAPKGISQMSVTSNYSNVTISSVDDIGGGNKVDFAYQITAPTQGNNNTQNRNSHIGLVGDSWGGVWWGTNENIYERYLYSIDPLDGAAGIGGNLQMMGTPGYGHVFDAIAGNPSSNHTGSAEFYHRTEHTVWYDSPNWNGFTFGVAWQMPAYKSNASNLNPTMWDLGVKYASPAIPLAVWAAYEKHNDYNGIAAITNPGGVSPNTVTNSSDHGTQLGVSYTLGDVVLFGIYEMLKYQADYDPATSASFATAVQEYKRNAFDIGLKWNLATGYVGAQYIQALSAKCTLQNGGGCNADGTEAKMISAGYYHTLSKQSQAYVVLSYTMNGDWASYGLAGAATPNAAPGANQSALTVGLKHSF